MSPERRETARSGALTNLRVLDLTHHVAGPYCTKLLAGFGAEVIKVERPGDGDPVRSQGPFVRGHEGDREASVPFLWLNTGKKSVTLDLKHPKGVELFKRLAEQSDVVVENFSPRVMPSLGLAWETLHALNPRLIMTSISNFGQTGPYRDYQAEEITAQALAGHMHMTGDPGQGPLAAGPEVAQYNAGLHAHIGTLMAVFARDAGEDGQRVDISIQEAAIECIEMTIVNYLHHETEGRRNHHPMVPWDIYPCADGWAAVQCGPFRHWENGVPMFGEPRLAEPRYRTFRGRIAHRAEVESLIRPWLLGQRKQDVFLAGQAKRLAFGYLASFDEVLANPQHRAREFFVDADHPVAGKHVMSGPPFKMSETPWNQGRAPLLGEHSDVVYGELLGCSGDLLQGLRREGVV